MRIGIDTRSLQNASVNRGIGTYTRCIVKNLLKVDKGNEYVFFIFKNRPLPALLDEFKLNKKVKIIEVDYARKHLYWSVEQFLLPVVLLKERLDIYHSPEFMVPVLANCKKVITVHDFIYKDFPAYKESGHWLTRFYFSLRDKTLKAADKIITVSEYTKNKIMELTGINDNKIQVIYEAMDDIFAPKEDVHMLELIKAKYRIKGDFLLYVGTFELHKNVDNLIKAFCLAHNRIEKGIDLFLVGDDGDLRNTARINKLIDELGVMGSVHLLDFIPPGELAYVYCMAQALIQVSFYEGFGLPVAEAMSCGKPVIVSDNTSLKEITTPAGVQVNPYNVEQIAEAIIRVLSSQGLMDKLSKESLSRAREFSWEKAARETLAVYEEVLG